MEQKFIIWDPRDNYRPREDDDGNIVSDGLIGRVGRDNVYIRTYAQYGEDVKRDINGDVILEVGQFVEATFRLSGEKGIYRVYRVQ
jgi:hypothetical protein